MVDMTNDVIRFEQMFGDRFTEKDDVFIELKSKSLANPVVIHPWKVIRKQWHNKRWDYSNRRNQDDRGHRGYHKNDDRHRKNSYDRYNDRAREAENSREQYRDRSEDGRRSRERYRDRSEDGKQDRSHNSQDGRHTERKSDFHSAVKTYQDR